MRKIVALLTICILIGGCKADSKKTIEGDLYFKLIDFVGFADAPDSALVQLEARIKTENKDSLTEEDKKLYDLLQLMQGKELLRKPFIRLRQNDGKIIMVFLDTADYNKIKAYKYTDLVRDNEKVSIKAEVAEIKSGAFAAYEALKPISIENMAGKTYWEK
jgi:hypothetical protein